GIILLLALIPVLGVDVFLHARSREALKQLAQVVAPRARVVRDNHEMEVPTEELVPGDVLVLREGDVLHADGVVRWSANLTMNESPLTGEPVPQEKQPSGDITEGERPETSRFYAGSLVLAGHGYGEIVTTGARTQYGHIAHLVAEAPVEPTPLQKKTAKMVRTIGAVAGCAVVGVFAVAVYRGASTYQAFLAAISLAMAAVPEEFPLVFTLFLSLGAWRLGQRGVLVRRLASVETLGSTTVICTDKTGTLTTGQFALDLHLPSSLGVSEQTLLEAAVLACEPHPSDTLERAIVAHCRDHGILPEVIHTQWRLVADHPFDPLGKHMSHVWAQPLPDGGQILRIVAKGALEGIVEHCALTPEEQSAVEATHASLAHQGIRVLAIAEKVVTSTLAQAEEMRSLTSPEANGDTVLTNRVEAECGLRFCGFLGFRDPLRPEVPAAVAECQAAGITVKLITGDHALTALAVADAAGIAHTSDGILTGRQLERSGPGQFSAQVANASIFARVRPEQKSTIVEALKRAGGIVAMTGDGINDAPALRQANIGISMGLRATEVARASADLVLLDDNFASLVATVREGRLVFANIQRAFLYLIAFHVPIFGLALVVPLLDLPLLLLPVHLVWLEMIVHPVSALIFEGEPAPPDLMQRPPRDPESPVLPFQLALPSLLSGMMLTAAVFGMYWMHLETGEIFARSGAIVVLILGSLVLIWAERAGHRPWYSVPWPRTVRFWMVWSLVAVSLPLFMHIPPIAETLGIGPLPTRDWMLAAGIAITSVGWRAWGTRWLTAKGSTWLF
ncbi:MAG: cation-translocating P-type ATPase, partial [Nitrospirota bacterium]|nr:cation-translocating P-type ATPase [Nitrospirota bacterium]